MLDSQLYTSKGFNYAMCICISNLRKKAFNNYKGEVWYAKSTIGYLTNFYVMVIGAQSDTLYPADLNIADANYMYFEANTTNKISKFDSISWPDIYSLSDFRLYTIVPVIDNGWVFLGMVLGDASFGSLGIFS